MNQTKNMTHTHTPGPWSVTFSDMVSDAKGRKIADCELTPFKERPKSPNPEDIANARLISAAPELLEALQMLASIEPSNCSEMCPYERGIWETAKDAIAKATGKGKA